MNAIVVDKMFYLLNCCRLLRTRALVTRNFGTSAGEVSERGRSEREERSIARGSGHRRGHRRVDGGTRPRRRRVRPGAPRGSRTYRRPHLDLARPRLPGHLGASWIPGFAHNPIARLARRRAIAIVRTNISSVTPARYRSMVIYDGSPTGSRLVMTFSRTCSCRESFPRSRA